MKRPKYLSLAITLFFLLYFSRRPVAAAELPNPYYPKYVGQCTWYAAEMRPDLRFNYGNGASWATKSAAHGYLVDTTPEVGAIAVWASNQAGAYSNGHVAYVVGVTDSTHFRVQEYNWAVSLGYGERAVTLKNGIQFVHTSGYGNGGSVYTPPPLPNPVISYLYSVSPASGFVGERVTITAGAQDTAGNRSIDSITIYLNDQLLGNINGSSGSFIWDTSGYQDGTYTINIKAHVSGWTGTVSQKSVSFSLQQKASTGGAVPAAPTLVTPANREGLSPTTDVILTWNSVPGSPEYKIELWGNPYGSMTPCDWQSRTSCHIGTMYPGTFSWHVRARNSSGQESEWSDTWTFTVQGPTPTSPPTATKTNTPQPQAASVPSLHDPLSGSNYSQSQDIWFAWNYVSNANQYYLEYWGGPYGTLNSGWINDVAYHVGTMWPGTYNWHVKSRGQNGVESNWSDTWTFTISSPVNTSSPPTEIPPTAIPTTAIPPTPVPTATPVPQSGFLILVDDLSLRTESGSWPPSSGQKIVAHIKIKNGGDSSLHVEHIGVRGRRNNSESWDIGFWTVDLNGHDIWSLDPNNEHPLASGNYSFRISYSLDGSTWTEVGNEINFTVP